MINRLLIFRGRKEFLFWLLVIALIDGCAAALPPREPAQVSDSRLNAAQKIADKTLPYQQKLPPVKPGEWRSYWNEKTESPAQYLADHPQQITAERTTLYLQPLGEFTPAQLQNHQTLREFLAIYFNSPVKLLPVMPLAALPNGMAKTENGKTTIRVMDFTDKFLLPRLPENGWGLMALCANDLFKSAGITGLYGDTLLYGRAGAISWFHLGDDLSLMLKGASHECAHMLSLKHCQQFQCNMNGRITLTEFHRAPLYLCPDCLTKLMLAAPIDPLDRYRKLANFCARYNLQRETDFYRAATQALTDNPAPIALN